MPRKRQKLQVFLQFQGQYEEFFVYKFILSLDESSLKQQIFPLFRTLPYLSTKSVDKVTKIEQKL